MNSHSIKLSFTALLIFLLSNVSFAQALPQINYQAAIRDANGAIQANTSIDIRFTVYSGPNASSQEYQETHLNEVTNDQGIINLKIGDGDTKNGDLATVGWHEDTHHLQIEIDLGSGFTDLGTNPLVSVPYALAAQKVADMSLTELNELKGLNPTTDQILKFDGTNWILSSDENTDSQTLSVSGNNLSISNGNSVVLPSANFTAGNGIQITGSTITNSAPDQTVSLSGSGATSVSGTYPNFTINSTDNNTTYTGGTGININGTTINNSSPDQTVSLSGTGATTVSGTYPNFTINSTDNNTTYTAGAGINLAGTTFEADSAAPIWNAGMLQNIPISSSTPADSNVLRYNTASGQWEFTSIVESPWTKVSSGIVYSGISARLNGANGNANVALASNIGNADHGWLGVMNDQGLYRSSMTVLSSGGGYIGTRGPNGNDNVSLTNLSSQHNHGWISTDDSLGQAQALMTILQNGAGFFQTRGSSGNSNIVASHLNGNSDHGWLGTMDSSGQSRTRMTILSSGEGFISTLGPNGNGNVSLTSLATNSNNGYVSVEDASGTTQAGIYVDANGLGIVFGDQKNFRVEHPKDKTKEIWYGSLEGPEMGAYHRGTATLQKGEVKIQLPEYYTLMANTNTMTVILTPLDASSKGLAVIEKNSEGFTVKELFGGKGNYAFDWEVKAKRVGLEDFQVVREAGSLLSPERGVNVENKDLIKDAEHTSDSSFK